MVMGSNHSSVITVYSSSPEQDVQVLEKVFPGKFRVEEGGVSETKILVEKQERITFLLMASSKPATPITWVVDEIEIVLAAKQDETVMSETDGGSIATINLPGGAFIIMVSPGFISLQEGRRELVRRLSYHSGETNGHNGHLPEEVVNGEGRGPSLKEEDGKLPRFPTLQVESLGLNGQMQPSFPINSRVPVDVETELFKGKILLLLRPPDPEDDPYWNERIWDKMKRRIVIQIQGKFKYEPGFVYAGAEVSDQMKLGLLARGLCGVLLKLVESFNSNVHYSFGEKGGAEKPHIVVPAYTFFERIVATPPDETPPPIDEFFQESRESMARRKASKSGGKWNAQDTYSLSFYSMYIDLPTWKLVSLPVSGDISLKTFWGNSLLNICMYEKTGSSSSHLRDSNRYAFSLQVRLIDQWEFLIVEDALIFSMGDSFFLRRSNSMREQWEPTRRKLTMSSSGLQSAWKSLKG